MLLIDYMGCPLASIVLVINQHIIKSILWSMSPWRLLIMLYSTPMYYVCCVYYNYNNISHNLYFYSKNTKSPMGKSQQRTEFSGLWQSSWSANSNYLHFWLSILKSVEEIHLRLYQSHKDPKFPGASGQSLCSRQIQIMVLNSPMQTVVCQYSTIFYGILNLAGRASMWGLQRSLYFIWTFAVVS